MNILKLISFVILAVLFLLPPSQGRCDESLFGYLYTTDTLPAGHWEYEQSQTFRGGKAKGDYSAIDLRNEFEYGVTDRFSASVYINSSFLYIQNVYDPEDVTKNLRNQNGYDVDGMSMEFRYRVLSPYTDGFGLALYAEPELGVRDHMTGEDTIERALELRLILQKNFMDDLLITAVNIMFEPEWEVMDGMSPKELWEEYTVGATYRFKPNWFGGLELRNHREFVNMDMGNQEHSAFFLGPNIHYGSEKWWATFTILPQIYGVPQNLGTDSSGTPLTSSYAHLGQHEKLEVRFKFGINI